MLERLFSVFNRERNRFSRIESGNKSANDLDESIKNNDLFLQVLGALNQPNIMEVYLNGSGGMSLRTHLGQIEKSCANYTTDTLMELMWCLSWVSRTRLDPYRPHGGGVVPGFNLRWHVVLPPLSPDGPNVVFRRQQLSQASLDDFVLENFSRADLLGWVQEGASIVFHGATGSGKTTALFASVCCFFQGIRLGIIESIAELPLISDFWFRLVEVPPDVGGKGGISLNHLKCEILRLSPQKIVIGEIRDSEAQLWAELSRTGHGGIMTTLHAGSHEEAYRRILHLLVSNKDHLPRIIGIHVYRGAQGLYHCRAVELN